jgi:hypothetical protein
MGAMTTHIVNIVEVNNVSTKNTIYSWHKERFIRFLGSSWSMEIGFVREGTKSRCVAFLSEPTDKNVLPIASSFNVFMNSFLRNVETTLQIWVLS